MRKVIAFILIGLSLATIAYVLYVNSRYSHLTRGFSPYTLLASSWESYKTEFIDSSGRVVDHSQNNSSTSEGQSYAMLRSVWVDDKPTFDKCWKWTKQNLTRPHDALFGWRWGKLSGGGYGFLSDGGNNSAADADSDIALALILATHRWGDDSYMQQAKPILNDMWNIETAQAAGHRYVTAGNWAANNQELIINPSYFAPYAWRVFAKVDTSHDWNSLIDPAYALLTESGKQALGSNKSVGLPPDWLSLNRQTGQITAPRLSNLTTNYSYDAMRVPWRIALDYQWNKSAKAKAYLTSSFQFLDQEYVNNGTIDSSYLHNGQPLDAHESPAMYATSLGYFMVSHPSAADSIYQDKIIGLYSTATNNFNSHLPYYDQNWLWFAEGLYHQQLRSYLDN